MASADEGEASEPVLPELSQPASSTAVRAIRTSGILPVGRSHRCRALTTTTALGPPNEGYTVWVDCLAIPTGANSVYGAHLWMDFICDVQNQADLTDWVWYLSPVPAAYELIESRLLKDNFPTQQQLANGELMDDVGEVTRDYSETWRRVKSA